MYRVGRVEQEEGTVFRRSKKGIEQNGDVHLIEKKSEEARQQQKWLVELLEYLEITEISFKGQIFSSIFRKNSFIQGPHLKVIATNDNP